MLSLESKPYQQNQNYPYMNKKLLYSYIFKIIKRLEKKNLYQELNGDPIIELSIKPFIIWAWNLYPHSWDHLLFILQEKKDIFKITFLLINSLRRKKCPIDCLLQKKNGEEKEHIYI